MKRRNTLHPAPEERKLRLRDRMVILSRRDRMGKAMPTWIRVLAAVIVLTAVLLLINGARQDKILNRSVPEEPLVNGTLRLSFTGDLDLSGNVESFGRQFGFSKLFTGVAPLWQDSSFVFSCLDGVILPEDHTAFPAIETEETPCSVLEEAVISAAEAGVNAFSLANDHSLDYGSAGIAQTVQAMERNGLHYAGVGENLPAAGDFRVLEADGFRIGFLSCSAINPNGAGPIDDYSMTTSAYSALYRNVLYASFETDYVVVYVCWGDQDGISVSDGQRRIAHQLIQSGADLVIGTHPHVLQPAEQFMDGWIFYSLGDLISDREQRGERESVLLRLDLEAGEKKGAFTLIPLLLEDYCPAATENSFYLSQIHQSLLRELPEDSYTIDDCGRITIPMQIS
ncbi:MAG: CapA family protein [Oscillospiraceae bacterium]|nr:CapA family protein [Oscillospiraceae bacterium]